LTVETGLCIQKATEAMTLNRSSWYYKIKPKNQKRSIQPLDTQLVQLLSQLTGYALTLGYRKTAAYFVYIFNYLVNHKKMYRHMNVLGLLQPKHVRKPRKRKPPSVMWYCPLVSNMRWESDLTLIPYQHGHVYLFSVIDVYDKELIGSWIGFRCRKEDAIEALRQAVFYRFPSGKVDQNITVTVRLDRGCQFTSFEFAKAPSVFGLTLEFCDVKAPNQKPFIESFFSNFKREEVYRNEYNNPAQAFIAWPLYVDWYNSQRPHGALNYLSPAQFRQKPSLVLS
jgi:transposase InsO family protein